tara:strand:- start:1580 stop:2287 length:708 start_codon:yes stop_codon:yes gene_type:complete
VIDFYKENGYLIVKNFLSDTDHKKLLDVSDYYYQKGKGGKDTPRFKYNTNGTMNKIEGACSFEPLFLDLASNETLIDTAQVLSNIGNEVDVYISKFFPMEPNGGQSTFMHQDNFYFKGNPNEIISCAVYLEDTNKDNGCLRVAKGSHKNSIYPHKVNSGMSGIKWIDDNVLSEFEIIDLDDKAPYAVFFNINTIHGCYTNESENSRFSLAWEYISHYNSKVTNVNQPWCDRTKVV